MQHINFSQCTGGEWIEESIPISEIIPQLSYQESKMTDLLFKEAQVQGVSSNIKGDRTCIDFHLANSGDFPPREQGESLIDYAKRTLGFGLEEHFLSEEQIQARDKMKMMQLNNEWKTMHAYHYPQFVPHSFTPAVTFDTSQLRRTRQSCAVDDDEEEEKEHSYKRSRGE